MQNFRRFFSARDLLFAGLIGLIISFSACTKSENSSLSEESLPELRFMGLDQTEQRLEFAQADMVPRGAAFLSELGSKTKNQMGAFIHAAPGSKQNKFGAQYSVTRESVSASVSNSLKLAQKFNYHQVYLFVSADIVQKATGISTLQLVDTLVSEALIHRGNLKLKFLVLDDYDVNASWKLEKGRFEKALVKYLKQPEYASLTSQEVSVVQYSQVIQSDQDVLADLTNMEMDIWDGPSAEIERSLGPSSAHEIQSRVAFLRNKLNDSILGQYGLTRPGQAPVPPASVPKGSPSSPTASRPTSNGATPPGNSVTVTQPTGSSTLKTGPTGVSIVPSGAPNGSKVAPTLPNPFLDPQFRNLALIQTKAKLRQAFYDLVKGMHENEEEFQSGSGTLSSISEASGLANLGSTCFANAAHQFLFAHPDTLDFAASNLKSKNGMGGHLDAAPFVAVKDRFTTLLNRYYDAFDDYLRAFNKDPLVTGSYFLTESELIRGKRTPVGKFLRVHQLDSDEFLTKLMELLEYENYYAGFKEEVYTTFDSGTTTLSNTASSTTSLNLSVTENTTSLDEALEDHFATERMDDPLNLVKNPKGIEELARKRLVVISNGVKEPSQLLIKLDRYSFSRKLGGGKLGHSISVPNEIEIPYYPSTVTVDQIDPKSLTHLLPKTLNMSIRAVIAHHGTSPRSGHYIAYTYDLKRNLWTMRDDTHVEEETWWNYKKWRKDRVENGYIFLYVKTP